MVSKSKLGKKQGLLIPLPLFNDRFLVNLIYVVTGSSKYKFRWTVTSAQEENKGVTEGGTHRRL